MAAGAWSMLQRRLGKREWTQGHAVLWTERGQGSLLRVLVLELPNWKTHRPRPVPLKKEEPRQAHYSAEGL
jgi:hypothetical protein